MGTALRNNAEKSILINEYMLDLLTVNKGVVFDMFAGTGSMALACIKTGRFYVGCEPDQEVHTWATQRIGRAWAAHDRGELAASEAGVRRALAEQVHTRAIVRMRAEKKQREEKSKGITTAKKKGRREQLEY